MLMADQNATGASTAEWVVRVLNVVSQLRTAKKTEFEEDL
jgi:hypothetical protein